MYLYFIILILVMIIIVVVILTIIMIIMNEVGWAGGEAGLVKPTWNCT